MKRTLNIFSFYAVLIALLSLTSCTKDIAATDAPVIGPDGTYRGRIALELPVATMEPTTDAVQSRAAAETTVKDVWILQFKIESGATSLIRAEYTIQTAVGGNRLFVEAQFIPGENMKLMLVANTHDEALFATTDPSSTLTPEEVEAKTFFISATAGTGIPADDEGLLMIGSTGTISLTATTDPVLVTLKHTVAKITVSYDLSKLPEGASYTNVKMQLRRVPKNVPLTKLTTALYPTADANNFYDYTTVIFAGGTTGQAVWYMAPNLRGTGTATEPSEKTDQTAPTEQGDYCTYVELSGSYKVSPTATGTEVVYRLWLGENNIDDYNIAAGKLYEVNIIPVNASHFDSRIKTYLNGFDLSETDPDGEHSGIISWGSTVDYSLKPANCYIAYANKRVIVFDATKKPRSVVTNAIAHQGYNSGTESGTNNYYTGGVYSEGAMSGKSLVDDLDKSDIAEIKVVWQTAVEHGYGFTNGSGSTDVDFTQLTLNNSSAVKPFVHSISYENSTGLAKVAINGTGNALIAAYSAEGSILWSWHIWGTDTEPQATIDPGNTVNGSDKKFMDRNLGALSATATQPTAADAYKYFGLIYQWGRKEPFTGAGPQYTTTLSADVNSIPTAIFDKSGKWIQTATETDNNIPETLTKGGFMVDNNVAASTYILLTNPTTHYYTNGALLANNPNTWAPYNSTTATPKTIYDPCPYGYRVPKSGSWSGISKSTWSSYDITGGISWNTSWWSASGYRNGANATLSAIGVAGYYWSASSNNVVNQAILLNFIYNATTPETVATRCSGLSVRCVQE